MKINKIDIEGIGKFQNKKSVQFSRGLNIIYGKNEAGKTTLRHTITSMFFGFKPERTWKYYNKDTNQCSIIGEVSNGRLETCTVIRKFNKKATGFLEIQNSTKTIGNTSIFSNDVIDYDIYNSVYAVGIDELTEISKKSWQNVEQGLIQNFGVDKFRYPKEVISELDEEASKIYRKSGRGKYLLRDLETSITKANNKMVLIKNDLKKIEENKVKKSNLQVEIKEKTTTLEALKRKLEIASEKAIAFKMLSGKKNTLMVEKLKLTTNLKKEEDKFRKFANTPLSEFVIEVEKTVKWYDFVVILIGLLGIGAGYILEETIILGGFSAFTIICGMFTGYKFKKFRDSSKEAKENETLRKNEFLKQMEIEKNNVDILYEETIKVEEEILKIDNQVKDLYNGDEQNEEYNEKLLKTRIGNVEEETLELEKTMAAIDNTIENLYRTANEGAVEMEIRKLEAEYKEAAKKRDDLFIISNFLKYTDDIFIRENQPNVLRKASKYFNILTENKYDGVYENIEDEKRGLIIKTGADVITVDNKLSRGTQEQLYLSIRLALIEKLEEEGECLPLVFDEISVNFDSGRRQGLIDLIAEISKVRQILYFTCHDFVANELIKVDGAKYLEL